MVANKQNLRVPTSEQAREIGRKGGLASAKKYKERKTMREMLGLLLEKELENRKTGEKATTLEAMMTAAIAKAMKGDIKACEFIRDTIGEKPATTVDGAVTVEKVFVSEKEQKETVKHIEKVLADTTGEK